MRIPFEVNDAEVRDRFFAESFIEAIGRLEATDPPRWGNMTAQHMVEHLQWAFACSTGAIAVPCTLPPQLLERAKRFLHDNRPTPREFKNPLLGDGPPPHRYAGLGAAKSALNDEVASFMRHFTEDPSAVHTHPLFGPLGREEWHRSHFKHSYHHLLQFSLVDDPAS